MFAHLHVYIYMKKTFFSLSFFCFCLVCFSQKTEFKPAIISFYNLENLYDTVDNPITNDEEFLPAGPRNYNSVIYFDKLGKLATVISQIGTEINPDGPALLGVAEVENDTVLTDLVRHKLIEKRRYQIVPGLAFFNITR